MQNIVTKGSKGVDSLIQSTPFILGLQPIPGDPKDNGVAGMLEDRTFCFVIQHGRHAIVLLDLQGLVANQELQTPSGSRVGVINSGNLFQSNALLFICCPYYRGVRNSKVSARRELAV